MFGQTSEFSDISASLECLLILRVLVYRGTSKKMASSNSEDNNDLLFLEDVLLSQDETDTVSSKVLSMDKDSELPPKYLMRKIFSPHREPPCHFDPAEEKILRRKKVT